MYIHKEGKQTILLTAGVLLLILWLVFYLAGSGNEWLKIALCLLAAGFWGFIISFFRNPKRVPAGDNNCVVAPADGKIVVIEETEETEYFKDRRLQVSIFMSPANVHVNRNPVSGTVSYTKYHPGKYLVAWHPKSSTENERNTVVFNTGKQEVLCRQIAGALARRIVNYVKPGDKVERGADFGFIKFGSRVDVFLPLGTPINVSLNEMVQGNTTILAKL